ncbi:alpha/beta hydrolase [Lichenihabitans sp. Uapishka_5]|uniref:alpha/beta fold hydrolase n=1 Tax=Lichenihabitans sp. Uapishka_5 TaxID=3037302 RepID=UPI0029E80900|nr:alpha/beta hydrolase [Lichenihabitans sp. Uapishka_5]MDX7952569.1 alpha/beta hydrolase [Lichenihabitans sp. Uapishka_5]
MSETSTAQFPTLVVGHGPIRVVVAHGWMGDHHLFDDMLPLIDEDRFSFAFFDCRGYGIRADAQGGMTVEDVARDVVTCADAQGWHDFHVLGHSMGAMAAQRLMVDHPDRLRSAILVAPVPASGAKIDDARRSLLREAMASRPARRNLIDVNTGRIRDDGWLDRLLDMSISSTTPACLEAYMASWTGTDFAAEAMGNATPVVVVIGELDPGAPVERIQASVMASYPNAQMVRIEGCGHYPMLEDPERLYQAVASFASAV